MNKIKASPLFAVWILFLLKLQGELFLPLICAVALHEAGHLLVACILKIKIKCFRLSILGARIETAEALPYKDEFLLSAGGPFMGFLGFALARPLAAGLPASESAQGFLLTFATLSLLLTLFNLIPLATLDGGRILFCLLCSLFSLDFSLKIMRLVSFFTLFAFWILSVYLVLKLSAGLQALVFCSIFFAKCFVFNNESRDFESF